MKKTLIKLPLLLALAWFASAQLAYSQEFYKDLMGFRLGQFRYVPLNSLHSKIDSGKFDDGFEYDIFLVEPDTSVYMVFEYAPNDPMAIWSIQVTGTKKGYDCKLNGLKFGMSEDEVISILGKPDEKKDIGDYGTGWEYKTKNITLEINLQNVLSSVKVIDKSDTFFPKEQDAPFPTEETHKSALFSKNRKQISEVISPAIEVFIRGKKDVVSFKKTFAKELEEDASGVYTHIEKFTKKIKKVNTADSTQFETNLRLVYGRGTYHVWKYKKKDKQFAELVFNYSLGKFLIWEMKY